MCWRRRQIACDHEPAVWMDEDSEPHWVSRRAAQAGSSQKQRDCRDRAGHNTGGRLKWIGATSDRYTDIASQISRLPVASQNMQGACCHVVVQVPARRRQRIRSRRRCMQCTMRWQHCLRLGAAKVERQASARDYRARLQHCQKATPAPDASMQWSLATRMKHAGDCMQTMASRDSTRKPSPNSSRCATQTGCAPAGCWSQQTSLTFAML